MIAQAVRTVGGNIEDIEAFTSALENVYIESPGGPLEFDDYRMAIHNYYVLQVEKRQWNTYAYVNKIVKTYENLDQFYPYTPEEFLAMPKLKDLKGTLVGKGKL